MNQKQIDISLVLSSSITQTLENKIRETLGHADYELNEFKTIADFIEWYKTHPFEVCLITDEKYDSQAYISLKEEYSHLIDILLVEFSDRPPEKNVFIAFIAENNDIDLEVLSKKAQEAMEEVAEMNDKVFNDRSHLHDLDGDSEESDIDIENPSNGDAADNDEVQPPSKPPEPKSDEKIKSESPTENKETPVQNLPENDVKSSFQNNPFPMRLRNIQKSLSGPKMDKYKTIGVWSPLPAIGVTSFIMNFALFLSENKVHTAVLESLTSNHILKDWLSRYSPIPEKWVSLASNLHANEPVGDSEWLYRGVKFFPLSKDDIKQEWNSDSFGAYHRMTEIYDVTLIDMPTGEMNVFTKESLEYMDELWIVVDDRVQQLNSWKEYIKTIKETHQITIYLIHNKIIDASKPNILSEGIGAPMLAAIPALWEETAKNYYQTKPLYLQKGVQSILQAHYHQLATHLIGSSFQLQEKKPTMWEQIAKIGKFQNILNG